MLAQDIIRRKRDGYELTDSEVFWFVDKLTRNKISESQVAAFAMAVFFCGMTTQERVSLTKSMRDSGRVLKWRLSGPVIDKHSTGGVGDCVSLLLAPALAACGGYVPMISGRGLGHTGGTLDKFDAIPGYTTAPGTQLLKKTVKEVGCAIVGQTGEIAPADRRFYAVRDVTATIESVDLITASILSKKLAVSLDALVLDIKFGNGAFMKEIEEAQKLASSLVEVSNSLGCKTSAMLSDMNEPLCSSVGNSLEVMRSVEVLVGSKIEPRLLEVVCTLGGRILASTGLSTGLRDGVRKIEKTFESGHAAEIFEKMVSALGGPKNFLNTYGQHLPKASIVEDVFSDTEGYINSINTRAIGVALLELGGARKQVMDQIDYAVGLERILPVASFVDKNTPLIRIHAQSNETLEMVKPKIKEAFNIGRETVQGKPLIFQFQPI